MKTYPQMTCSMGCASIVLCSIKKSALLNVNERSIIYGTLHTEGEEITDGR